LIGRQALAGVHAKIVHIISIFHQRTSTFDIHHFDDSLTPAEGLPTLTIIIEPHFLLEGRERKKGLGVVLGSHSMEWKYRLEGMHPESQARK